MKKGFTKAKDALERGVDATLEQLERVFNPSFGWIKDQLDIVTRPLQKPMQALDRTVEDSMKRLRSLLTRQEEMKQKIEQKLLEEEELPLEEKKGMETPPLTYGTLPEKGEKGPYDQYSYANGKEGAYGKRLFQEYGEVKNAFRDLDNTNQTANYRTSAGREMDIADNALKFGDYVKAKSALLLAEKYLALSGVQRFYKMFVFRDMIRENYIY